MSEQNEATKQVQPIQGFKPIIRNKATEAAAAEEKPAVQTDVLDLNITDEPKGGKVEKKDTPIVETPKLNLSRFKSEFGFEKDFENEDEVINAWKADRAEKNKYSVLAQGRAKLDNDNDYKSLNQWVKADNHSLVRESLVHDYVSGDGLSREEAIKKADAKIEARKAADADWVDDTARGIKKNLRETIAGIENRVVSEIEEARKEVSFVQPSQELEKKVSESLKKQDGFLGLTFSDKDKEKMLKDADIPLAELQTALKDPDTLAKIKIFLKYEKQLTANIKARNTGRADVLSKLAKSPAVDTASKSVASRADVGRAKTFNPDGFLGRKAS